ncbi:MAG TPA: radical SAM protein [Fimbriimonas sp.]|nr:radical SAM protein [Fimbriimonas sp.]
MPGLSARPYTIEEYTRAVCPTCVSESPLRADAPDTFKDAMLVSRDGKIWLKRFCSRHGEVESLYEEDAGIWRNRHGWSTPTSVINADRADNWKPFPDGYREGLPHSHGQHTCVLVLNVTESCNFSCPTCYAAARSPGDADPNMPTISEIGATVDAVSGREGGKVSVVMLSGGEPTVRKDLENLLLSLFEKNITRVMINTNGRRIARDDRFLNFLKKHRDKVEVYLQFDGLRPSTHLQLRGEDLTAEKKLALERLNRAGIYCTLVMTVEQGVNEDEVGDVVQTGLQYPRCAGVAIQPVFGSGRSRGVDGSHRVTPTGVLSRLAEQTNELIGADDFVPLPCSHRDCCDITYLLRTRQGWKSLPKLIGRDELKKWIHVVSNTISFESASDAVKQLVGAGIIQRVLSEQQKVHAVQLAADIFSMCQCAPGLSEMLRFGSLESLAERTFRVTVKMFMDAHTFHEHRIRQCCVHVGSFEEDPRRTSFCWRWLFADSTDFPSRPGLQRLPVVTA